MQPDALLMPRFTELMWPTLEALKTLGGSGTVREIDEQVFEIGNYSEEQRSVLHRGGPRTELAYLLRWARSYLKRAGALENSRRGIWSITDRGRALTAKDIAGIPRQVRAAIRATSGNTGVQPQSGVDELLAGDGVSDQEPEQWQEQLIRLLLELEPASFERLAQRLLREQGLISVSTFQFAS
jgi:restriction system protein